MKNKNKLPANLTVNGRLTNSGLVVAVNQKDFTIKYPQEIWHKYGQNLQKVLLDNIVYSSTIFLPQILNLLEINYKTARPLAEAFLFKNGIYDMPTSAIADNKSSRAYVDKFFNTQYFFGDNKIKTPKSVNFNPKKSGPKTAIIPFSFGKESILSLRLCRELGIKPILVNFVEPSHDYEYFHKKKLITEFEREMKVKVYVVEYKPGIFRYGKLWGLSTDLGWGLHTTDYTLLTLPLVSYFSADYIILGNEQSCNDVFFDKEGMLTYKAAYDQHRDWAPQQSLLTSMLLGRKVEVISFMEPLYELAITRILHHRYPEDGKYQMSCNAYDNKAKYNRWCQACTKCGYIYALCCAAGCNLAKVGFTQNLFDKSHSHIYDHFFNYDPKAPAYGSQEELGLAFYLAYLRGCTGYSIDKFKSKLLPMISKKIAKLSKQYLGINSVNNTPKNLLGKVLNIYNEELNIFKDELRKKNSNF